MGKWYVGFTLVTIGLVLMGLHLYLQPFDSLWQYTETDHYNDGTVIHRYYEYSYSYGYVKTDYYTDLDGDGQNETQSPKFYYSTSPDETNNTYEKRFAFNAPAEEGGRPTLMKVFNTAYYMSFSAFIILILVLIFLPLAGYGKLSPGIPKALMIIAAVLFLFSALYLVFSVPDAIDRDDITKEKYEYKLEHGVIDDGYVHKSGNGTDNYWGGSYMDLQGDIIKEEAEWGAGYGWWILMGEFLLLVIGSSFRLSTVESKKKKKETLCPACGRPMRFVSQYADWYCDHCELYLSDMVEEKKGRETPPSVEKKPQVSVKKQQRSVKKEMPPQDEEDDNFLEW